MQCENSSMVADFEICDNLSGSENQFPDARRILMWPLTYHYLNEDVGILETHVQATITMDDASVQSLV